MVSTTGRQLGILPGARRTIVPIAVIISLPSSRVGLSDVIKSEWENIRLPICCNWLVCDSADSNMSMVEGSFYC